MNREIKFRIWDTDNNEFFPSPQGQTINSLIYSSRFYEKRYIFQQFTGLKDKNSREIYEGDILEDENGLLYEVFWLDTTASFELAEKQEPSKDYNTPTFHFRSMFRLKVVSNKFKGMYE